MAYHFSYFSLLLLISNTAVVDVPRYRDREVMQNDKTYTSILFKHNHIHKYYYNLFMSLYAGFLKKNKEDVYSIDHAISRTNDVFVC